VLELLPEGPVFFGGDCQGATIALNIAQALQGMQRPVTSVFLLDKTPPINYAGHVSIFWSRQSFLNPYQRYETPEKAWARRYRSHTLDFIECDYNQAFAPPHHRITGALLVERMAELAETGKAPLPTSAYSLEWSNPDAPRTVRPGAAFSFKVSVKNTSAHIWGPTDQTGLRTVGHWSDARGKKLGASRNLGVFKKHVLPGQSLDLTLSCVAPEDAGPYQLGLDIAEEGRYFFSDRGTDIQIVEINVDPAAPKATAISEQLDDAGGPVENSDLKLHNELLSRALALYRQKDWAGAAHLFEASHTLQPANFETLIGLANTRFEQGRWIAAKRSLGEASTVSETVVEQERVSALAAKLRDVRRTTSRILRAVKGQN